MKHLFIVNPTAGGRDATADIERIVSKAFSKRSDEYEIYVTTAPMDAPGKIQKEAEECSELRVYACGGDGTFNECVCGAAMRDNVSVCPFPTGTGNDFCRMFGDDAALYRDVDRIINGSSTKIDLIDCCGRWCANICSVGIDARIGADVHKYSKLPIIGGSGGYVISAIINMFKGIARYAKVSCGSFTQEGKHTLICACNGRFYGGGFKPCPAALPNDGIMDIIVAKKTSLPVFAALISKYAAGRADEFTEYAAHLRNNELRIELDCESVVNVDGEIIRAKNIDIRLVPNALNLVVPVGMSFFENEAKIFCETGCAYPSA